MAEVHGKMLLLEPGETLALRWIRTGSIRITRGWFGYKILVEEESASDAEWMPRTRRWRKLRRGEPMTILGRGV